MPADPHERLNLIDRWLAAMGRALKRLQDDVADLKSRVQQLGFGSGSGSNSGGGQWFYTTSAIPSATVSATGTALGSASLLPGHGTGRRCKLTGSGTSATWIADTSAADETLYGGVVYTTTIATGSYAWCVWLESRWEVRFVARCPGT